MREVSKDAAVRLLQAQMPPAAQGRGEAADGPAEGVLILGAGLGGLQALH